MDEKDVSIAKYAHLVTLLEGAISQLQRENAGLRERVAQLEVGVAALTVTETPEAT